MFLTLFGPLTQFWRGEKEAKTWDAVVSGKSRNTRETTIFKRPGFLYTISRVSSGAAARKASAAVFIYAKRSLTKQMRRWECARRVNRLF